MKAFEAHAIDYLLKPFSRERFDKAIQKWRNLGHTANGDIKKIMDTSPAMQLPSQPGRIVVKDNNKIQDHPASADTIPGKPLMIM